MKKITYSTAILMILFFSILQSYKIENKNVAIDKDKILKLVNDHRKKGCYCGTEYFESTTKLVWNNKLESAAQKHAKWMSDNKKLSHKGKNNSSAGDRIKNEGYKWSTYGENVANGYETEEEVVEGWINSPGHCKNIMNPNFKEMGVAKSGEYWAQAFGTEQ